MDTTRGEKNHFRTIAHDKSGNFDAPLDNHFLANRSLRRRTVQNLLLSASFGANSLLYAVFLGYLMGLWGFLAQFAWAASFFLLARFGTKIHRSASLHEFLGERFGETTRKLAAACSIVGITYFVGWEIAVARSSLQSVIDGTAHGGQFPIPFLLLSFAVGVALFYTTRWGRRASGSINVVLNTVKVICLVLLVGLMAQSFLSRFGLNLPMLLPPFGEAMRAIGLVGFMTNIVFNISWQFVDNSSWQSISSSASGNNKELRRSITQAGLWTLLTVNGIGTILGALLRPVAGVDSANALGQLVQAISLCPGLAVVTMIVLIIFSAISLFDGAILSVSQSLVVDIGLRRSGRLVTLRFARVVTLVVGIAAAWGVERLIGLLGGSIFDMVYIVILTQLCLIGPVIVGLVLPKRTSHMWVAVAISLGVAVGLTVFGTLYNQTLLQLAGTLVTIVSIGSSLMLYVRNASREPSSGS